MNFDKMIEDLLKSGKDLDTIADEFDKAYERASCVKNYLEYSRAGLIDNINAAISINNFDFKIAVSAITVAMIDQGYIKSKDEADRFFKELIKGFECLEKINAVKDEKDFSKLLKELGL